MVQRSVQFGFRIRDYHFKFSNDGMNWTTIQRGDQITASTPDYYAVRLDDAVRARYIRLVVGHSLNQNPLVIVEFEVYYDDGTVTLPPVGNLPDANLNLAHRDTGAVMGASSSHPARPATLANDGVRHSYPRYSWQAADVDAQYLYVDFGEVRNFNHVRIYQAGTRIRNFTFKYYADGTWHPFFTGNGSSIMVESPVSFDYRHGATIQSQRVKLHSAQSSQPLMPIAVFQFEVYYMP